jgi:hypothetical protein
MRSLKQIKAKDTYTHNKRLTGVSYINFGQNVRGLNKNTFTYVLSKVVVNMDIKN